MVVQNIDVTVEHKCLNKSKPINCNSLRSFNLKFKFNGNEIKDFLYETFSVYLLINACRRLYNFESLMCVTYWRMVLLSERGTFFKAWGVYSHKISKLSFSF